RLLRAEAAPYLLKGRRADGEFEGDFVGKPSPIVTRLFAAAHCDRMPAETTERIPGHSTAVTIGAARREVNGTKRMSDVRRNDAAARTRDHRSRARNGADPHLEIP